MCNTIITGILTSGIGGFAAALTFYIIKSLIDTLIRVIKSYDYIIPFKFWHRHRFTDKSRYALNILFAIGANNCVSKLLRPANLLSGKPQSTVSDPLLEEGCNELLQLGLMDYCSKHGLDHLVALTDKGKKYFGNYPPVVQYTPSTHIENM